MSNPDPIIISNLFGIKGLDIRWYGVIIVIGIIIAIFLASHEVKRRKLPSDTALDLSLICIPCGLIGARLYYVLFSHDEIHSFMDVIDVTDGGLGLYGVLIGGLLGAFIYTKIKKLSFLTIMDTVLPGFALAQALGRWGNFFNQEAYGPLVTNPDHMWFPLAVKIDKLNELHYATFFYESVCCLIIFLILWFVIRKKATHRGDVALAYIIMYGFERMFIELLRADSLMLGSIRISHALSAVLCIGGIVFVIVRHFNEKRLGCKSTNAEASDGSDGIILPDDSSAGEDNEPGNAGEIND